jgi:hypothetical protein
LRHCWACHCSCQGEVFKAQEALLTKTSLRLVETIAVGSGSPTVMAAIAEREARIREITNQAIEPVFDSLEEKLDELRTFAVARLTSLRELIANPTAVHEARELLAEQVGKFTLDQVDEGG